MTARPDDLLHSIDVNDWTAAEVQSHLTKTFNDACRDFTDIMEPYATRVAGLVEAGEIRTSMRIALRKTFTQRWPNRFAQPITEQAAE